MKPGTKYAKDLQTGERFSRAENPAKVHTVQTLPLPAANKQVFMHLVGEQPITLHRLEAVQLH
jgi:hypothetical protein